MEEIRGEISGRVGALINKMAATITIESERLGCWAILGEAGGAKLVFPGKWYFVDN